MGRVDGRESIPDLLLEYHLRGLSCVYQNLKTITRHLSNDIGVVSTLVMECIHCTVLVPSVRCWDLSSLESWNDSSRPANSLIDSYLLEAQSWGMDELNDLGGPLMKTSFRFTSS